MASLQMCMLKDDTQVFLAVFNAIGTISLMWHKHIFTSQQCTVITTIIPCTLTVHNDLGRSLREYISQSTSFFDKINISSEQLQ